jgi:ethanolamine utilization protein EutQ
MAVRTAATFLKRRGAEWQMTSEEIVMPKLIASPARIEAAGTRPKLIDEYVGRVSSATDGVSIAHMRSPAGWTEPRQRPEFHEYSVVLHGLLRLEHDGGRMDVRAGQAVIAAPGERVRYSTPSPAGAEYIAVCVPAFSPATVHREE